MMLYKLPALQAYWVMLGVKDGATQVALTSGGRPCTDTVVPREI